MRVTFVHTPNRAFVDTQLFGIHLMPVWAYSLAAHVATLPDVEMTLVDDRFDRLDATPAADVFCLSGLNQDHDALVAAHRALKARFPSARFLLGGPICWSYHTAGRIDALAMFDHVVVGDGEEALPALLRAIRDGASASPVIVVPERFPLGRARPMHQGLLAATMHRYYGAVLEVSRGCPFLCEFCDIRVLPDNNRAHVKDPALVVAELDALYDLGARQVLFACDNFIGDVRWAERLCDAIIDWQVRTGKSVSGYTWLTVNLARHPALMQKLRRAGFDLLFIGVESFNRSSLLETAKVQNSAVHLVEALQAIQSRGFVIVPGLIFGFDTDPDDVTDLTLQGILDSGLIAGDPSLLTALPGTPLYQRMQRTGRLRDTKLGLGGFKYQTNIRYLKPAGRVRAEFLDFVRRLNDGACQVARLERFYDLVASEHFVPRRAAGYVDLGRLVGMIFANLRATRLLLRRIGRLVRSPSRVVQLGRALALTARRTSPDRPLWPYFQLWLINWSNTLIKYASLTDADFDVASVREEFSVGDLVPDRYEEEHEEQIPTPKIRAQRRVTASALRSFGRVAAAR